MVRIAMPVHGPPLLAAPAVALGLALVVAVCAAPRAHAQDRDTRLLETYIKLTQARLAAEPGHSKATPAARSRQLAQELVRAGIPVDEPSVSRGITDAGWLASRVLAGLSPGKRRQVMEIVQRGAEEPADEAGPSPSEGEDEPSPSPAKSPKPSRPPARRAGGDADDLEHDAALSRFEPRTGPSGAAPRPADDEQDGRPRPGPSVRSRVQSLPIISTAASEYTLGPRDGLEIVYLDRQIAPSGKENEILAVTINLEGKVLVPLLGVVQAAGMTVEQFRQQLVEMYRKYLQNPRITIFVKQYASQKVYVFGEASKPGVFPLTGETTTLFDVIAAAGGLGPNADKNHIIIIRGQRKLIVNYQEELMKPGISEQFIVQPGDRIIVPKPMFKITVLGGVNRAGDFDFEEGMTLLRAIALAGSFNEGARREQIKVIRRITSPANPTQSRGTETFNVDATKIFRGKAKDVTLRPGDTIYVSEW